MYSVIKHTYELVNTESVTRTTGEWKHYVYIFDTIEQATRYAISVIIDLPMIEANDYFLSHAIESLVNHRYFQVGKESVAIGLVCDLPENVEKETEIYEKYLH
tara:strand:- start:4171 stop:4479 length:309 start_codon:yes stop_codon:yes gene_type:complete